MNRIKDFLSRHMTPRRWLAFVASAAFMAAVFVMPFMFEQPPDNVFWLHHAKYGAQAPLAVYEHYLEFNSDIGLWLRMADNFPYAYRVDARRINRPLYPAIGNAAGRLINLARKWPDWRAALTEPVGIGLSFALMLLLNYLIAVWAALLFYGWLERHFDRRTSLLAAFLFIFSPFWLLNSHQVATQSVSFFIIALTLRLFDDMLEKPSAAGIAWRSLAIGALMLAKMQYDIVAACVLWALLRRRWRVAALFIPLQALPLLLWIKALPLMGLTYYNMEVQQGQGVWCLNMLSENGFFALSGELLRQSGLALAAIGRAFSAPVLLCAGTGVLLSRKLKPEARALFLPAILSTLALMVMMRRTLPFYAFDAFVVVYPLAAAGFWSLAERFAVSAKTGLALACGLVAGEVLLAGFFVFSPYLWKPQPRALLHGIAACARHTPECVPAKAQQDYTDKLELKTQQPGF